MTIASRLAEWAEGLTFETIPGAARGDLSWHALDTLGVLLGATRLDYAVGLARTAAAEGGAPQATLIGAGDRVPVAAAVFANGCLGHGIDWDDTHLEALLHPTATILPLVLAMAEASGAGGAKLMTGLVTGIETMIRIGLASGHGLVRRGLHPTSMCGTFGAAIAAAKMLELPADKIAHALGIAGGMCAGLHESVIDGSMNKCIHSGIAAQAGLRAAELAAAGFTGPAEIFEGRKGYLNAFIGEGFYDAAVITRGLGENWHSGRLAYKAYACCQGAHPYADTALQLHDRGIDVADIVGITVRTGAKVGRTLCEPAEVKQRPPSAYGAKFSIPFVIATALKDGAVTLASFSDEALRDGEKLRLAGLVEHVVDPYYDVGMALRGYVEVRLRDGRCLIAKTDACTGTPENPWNVGGVEEKFRVLAVPVIGEEKAATLVRELPRLVEIGDVRSIVANLSGGQGEEAR